MNWEDRGGYDETYRERGEGRNEHSEGFMGTNHVFPSSEEQDEDALTWFHRAMTEMGVAGVEYAQEALHQNGTYFSDHFSHWEEVAEDIARYEDHE
jgi:hypothetical protein